MSLTDFESSVELESNQKIARFLCRNTSQNNIYRRALKPPVDIVLALLVSTLAIPVMVILAIIIALSGTNPIYTQERVGKNGKPFRMWKLRSMAANAEALLEVHLAENKAAMDEWGTQQKLTIDPRVTLLGRFIRKMSLDELPQLWNVLIGDMSLVGPRPILPCQKSLYPGTDYYDLLPGITGSWQISARNESTFADRAVFDTNYNHTLSFSNDLKILCKTAGVVVKGTGC